MPRSTLRYGHKILLHAPSSEGILMSTNSAIAPLGVRPNSKDSLLPVEDAIFMLIPGEGEYDSREDVSVRDEVKFGHVVRLVHNIQRCPVVHFSNEHAVLDKAAQRVTIDKPARNSTTDASVSLYRTERFRILPKYKVRGEGERVCEGDHIVLQSTLSSSSFVSASEQQDDRTDGCFEVQCTVEGCGFEIRFYDVDISNPTAAVIRGGQCVTLVHREANRLFGAVSLFGNTDDMKRTILLDAPQQLNVIDPLSSKGITHENLFIIEFEDRSRSGAIQVVERQRYRIKSLAANGYIAVDEENKRLFLTNNLETPGALFTFHAASDDRQESLESGGRIFIEAASVSNSCSQWLTLRNEPYEMDGEVLPYLGLQTKDQQSVSDGIEVQLLPFLDYRDISGVISLLPPLKRFVKCVEEGVIDPSMIMQISANVRKLRRMCFQDNGELIIDSSNEVDGILDHKGQNRLLHQGVPQLLLKITKGILFCEHLDRHLLHSAEDVTTLKNDTIAHSTSFNADPVRYTDIISIVDECLGVIQYIVRDNYRAAIELRDLLPTLISACDDIPAAVGCVAEFLRGNKELLEELADEGQCKDLLRFMDLLVKRPRDPVLMQLVGLFAADRDEGFPEAQRTVTMRLIDDVKLRDHLFFKYVRDESGTVMIEIPELFLAPKHMRELTVTRICEGEEMYKVRLCDLPDVASQTRMVGKPSIIPLVAGQLELLSAICAGRKATSIHALKDIITVDILMDAVDKIEVLPIIHAGLVNLFSSGVVIDCDCLSLEEVLSSMRYVVDDPNAPNPFQFEEDITDPYLVRSRDFAKKYLIDGKGSMSSDEGKREELDAVVRLTKSLLSRRCWQFVDFTTVLHFLTAYLDKRNDTATNDPEVFRDKVTLIRTIDGFVDVILGIRAARITREFVSNPEDPFFPPMCQFVALDPFSKLSENFEARGTLLGAAQSLKSTTVFPEVQYKTLHYTLEVLQDIACAPNWELRKEAIRFFCRLTHQWETLFYTVENVNVSTSSNTELFTRSKAASDELLRYLVSRKQSHKSAAALQVLISQLESRTIETPRKTAGGTKQLEASEGDVLGIYQHLKVVDSTLTILGELENISKARTSESGLTDVCLKGLQFLEIVAEIDDASRQKIGNGMEKLFFSAIAAPLPFLSVCRSVFVDTDGAHRLAAPAAGEMVDLIARGGRIGDEAIQLLRDILAVKDSTGRYNSKNQHLVWRAILATKRVARMIKVHDSWTGKRGVEIRDAKLKDAQSSTELATHLSLMDLLFLTAKKNDLVKPEEIRYELFGPNGVDDLMEVVSNLELPATFRHTYINLLQVLVVEDFGGLSAMFNHRSLSDFLTVCRFDLHCAASMLEEQDSVVPMEQVASIMLSTGEKKNLVASYSHFSQRSQAYDFMGSFLCMAVLPCVRHLMERFSETARRLHPKVRNVLSNALNDVVSSTIEFVKALSSSGDDTVLQVLSNERLPRKKLLQFLDDAVKMQFFGSTGRPQLLQEASSTMQAYVDQWIQWNKEEEKRDKRETQKAELQSNSSISKKWQIYVQEKFGPLLESDRQMAGGAGVLLRNPELGTPFVATLVTSLPFLSELVACRVLSLLRQVLELNENDRDDCSVMLPFANVKGLLDRKSLTLLKTKEQRQDIAASFDAANPSKQILPLVTDLISRPSTRVRAAAIHTAISLLEGGNRTMQQVMYDSIQERSDEEIFVYLRDVLAATRETLLTYVKILTRKADPRDTLGSLEQVTKLLRLTQLLCEGHFREIQEYLRVQPLNIVSVNVIEAMCDALDVVSKAIDFRTISFATQLIVTLIEVLQGPCRSNQDFCVSAGIGERLVTILTLSVEEHDHDGKLSEGLSSVDPQDLMTMQLKCMDCLLALIEGRTEKQYLATLLSSISLETLCSAMTRSVEEYSKCHGPLDDGEFSWNALLRRAKSYVFPEGTIDELNDELSLAVNVFIFVRSCLDHQNLLSQGGSDFEFVDGAGFTIKRALSGTKCFHAVNRKVGMVEILRDGVIERSYFRVLKSSSANLLKKHREHLIKIVERDSDNRRLQSFLELSDGLIKEIEFYNNLRKLPLLSLFQDFDYVVDYLGLIWSAIINIVMLSMIHGPKNAFESDLSDEQQYILTCLSGVQIALQSCLMLNYMVGPMRIHYKSKTREWLAEKVQESMDEARVNLSVEEADVSEYRIENMSIFEEIGHAIFHTSMHGPFQQRVVFLVAAILGLTQSKIWYTIQLLHITSKSALLSNVLLAVTTNGVSLVLTLILMVIVIYIFSAVSFFHFSEFFDPDHLGRGYDCQSLASCWYLHIDSIRGGGVGDVTSEPFFDDSNPIGFYYAFFRLMFFIVIIVIFLNIVFGIIVDSFAQLREERDEVENDQQSKCFICGIDRNEFDHLSPGGFEQHITSEHNMWDYVFFMHYLQVKDKEELNGQEADVFEKLESRDTSFFPVGRSMATQVAAEESGDVEQQVSKLTSTMEEISDRCSSLEEQLHALSDAVLSELKELKAALGPTRPMTAVDRR